MTTPKRAELREQMARAIEATHYSRPALGITPSVLADTALAVIAAARLAIVPQKATEEMLAAIGTFGTHSDDCQKVTEYAAMIAAGALR